MKKITLIMGIPGSGKSHTAEKLAPANNIFTTDDYFMEDGIYKFDGSKIKQAHMWNIRRTEKAMREGRTPIVVPNTNTTPRERMPYKELAVKYGYAYDIQLPTSPWFEEIYPRIKDKSFTDKDVMEFFIRNTHNVPYDVINNMMRRWDETE